MKLWIILLILATLPANSRQQSNTEDTKSPKDVVEQFVKMDAGGARLTQEGWYRTAHFFVRPLALPQDKKILVVSDTFELREGEMKGDRAKFHVFFFHFYGQLDARLHFEPASHRASNGALIKDGLLSSYDLARTENHLEFEPGASEIREVRGPAEWKIENAQVTPTISLTTAIRYVTEMRDKTADPVAKKHADETLAALSKLH